MAKKRKAHRSRSPFRQGSKRPISLEVAQGHLAMGHLRDAIAELKALIKADAGNPQLIALLADAYAGRAAQLSAKGMMKEALAIWENRAALSAVAVAPEHAMLLIREGRMEEFGTLVGTCADTGVQAGLRTHIAAHWLAGNTGIGDHLAADDPILVHGEAARSALAAYCAGDDATLATALAKIPFRSPYRDLAQVLKALIKAADAPDDARRLLERIDGDSGFANLSRAVQVAIDNIQGTATAPQQTGSAMAKLVAALTGATPERQRLTRELRALGDPPDSRGLLKLIYRHRTNQNAHWVRSYGLRVLLPDFPDNAYWLREIRGLDPSDAEGMLVEAWDSEREGDAWDLVDDWWDCAQKWIPADGAAPGTDAALRVALMLRRAAEKVKLRDAGDADSSSLATKIADGLKQSLGFDPDDRDTYLYLVRHFLKTKDLKKARAFLKDAEGRWPKDKQVLTVAIETALASGAFKKAANIARSVLEVDPINTGVRALLVDSHIAHARKNLGQGRPDLAEKGLQQAREWARGQAQTEQLDLVAAFTALAQDRDAGIAQLRAITERLGNGLDARLAISLESGCSSIPLLELWVDAGVGKAMRLEIGDLLAFFERLRAYLEKGKALPAELAVHFLKPLGKAARLRLDKGQYEFACDTLDRAQFQDARRAFATAALKRWRAEPIFELHAIHAANHRSLFGMKMKDMDRLERALERARDAGDTRTAHRIVELLQSVTHPIFPPGRFPSPFFEDDEDLDDADPPFSPDDAADLGTLIDALGGAAEVKKLIASNRPLPAALKEMKDLIGKEALLNLLDLLGADSGTDPWDDRPPPRGRGRGPKAKPRGKGSPQFNLPFDLDDDF